MTDEYDEQDGWYDDDWVEVNESSRWRPRVGERVRALLGLLLIFGILGAAALLASPGSGDEVGRRPVTTSTTEEPTTTTTTTEPKASDSLDGEPPPEVCIGDDRGAAALRPPFEATVLVLNGTPRSGHAGKNTEAIKRLGYTTSVPDNATIRNESSIAYRRGFCAEAVVLAEAIDLARDNISEHPENDPIVLGAANLLLILGRDSL